MRPGYRPRRVLHTSLSLVLAVALPAKGTEFPPVAIANPFVNPLAIERLYESMPDTPAEMREFLPQIYQIEYAFEQSGECPMQSPTICSDLREKPYYRATRKVTIRLPDVTSTIAKAVKEMEYDGCSFLRTSPPRLVIAAEKSLVFQSDINATKRACGNYPWPFKGQWKTDIASGSGHVQLNINLEIEPSKTYAVGDYGSYKFNVPAPSVNISTSQVLGMIDSNSLPGKIFTKIVELGKFVIDSASFQTADLGLEEALRAMRGYAPSVNYLYSEGAAEKAIKSVPEFYKLIEQLRLTRHYFIDADRMRLTRDETGQLMIEIHQFTAVPGPLMRLYYAYKQNEIDFIADLPHSESRYVVQPGDNLWTISRTRYGSGDAWFIVAHANNLRSNVLQPSQELVLPRLWQLAKIDKFIVRPGDTLNILAQKTGGKLKLPVGSRNKNKIYPYQVVVPEVAPSM